MSTGARSSTVSAAQRRRGVAISLAKNKALTSFTKSSSFGGNQRHRKSLANLRPARLTALSDAEPDQSGGASLRRGNFWAIKLSNLSTTIRTVNSKKSFSTRRIFGLATPFVFKKATARTSRPETTNLRSVAASTG